MIYSQNQWVDACFYNTQSLTLQESAELDMQTSQDGSILIVPPNIDKNPEVKIKYIPFRFLTYTAETFSRIEFDRWIDRAVRSIKDSEAKVIAVAGLGSSALGAAAFAREIANTTGQTVVGLVSGDGLADIFSAMSSGLQLQSIDSIYPEPNLAYKNKFENVLLKFEPADPAINTLIKLYPPLSGQILGMVGHSRGNYVIAAALAKSNQQLAGQDFRVVTMGAVALFGPGWNVDQYIGGGDWFGEMNSVAPIDDSMKMGSAWHWTNPNMPYAFSVPDALKSNAAKNKDIYIGGRAGPKADGDSAATE